MFAQSLNEADGWCAKTTTTASSLYYAHYCTSISSICWSGHSSNTSHTQHTERTTIISISERVECSKQASIINEYNIDPVGKE